MVNRRLFSAVPSYNRSFPDTKPKGLSPSVLKQRAFACHPMCEPRHLEPHMFYRNKHLEILLKTPFKDGKRVLFWRSDCCLGFRPTTLGLRGLCTACCLGRTCRWPTKEACGRQTACLEGECSKEAPICLYLTSFLVHMCADGNTPPPPQKTSQRPVAGLVSHAAEHSRLRLAAKPAEPPLPDEHRSAGELWQQTTHA